MNTNRKTLVVIIALVGLAALVAAGLIGRRYMVKGPAAPADVGTEAVTETIIDSSTSGTLPDVQPLSNPASELPAVNPVEKANPFRDVYQNPFE